MTGSPETSAAPLIRVEVIACGNCAAAWTDEGPGCCVSPIRGNDAFPKWPATLAAGSPSEAMMRLGEASVIESRAHDALRDAREAAHLTYGDFPPPEVIEEIDRLSDAWTKAREDRNIALAISLEALQQRGGEQSPAARSPTPTEQSAVRVRRL